VPPDLPFERAPLQIEEALLFFEFLFDELQGWMRHMGLTLGANATE
jgi:hypothetical protein